jgi:branched-chain amino acid transport system substrate-binding protein
MVMAQAMKDADSAEPAKYLPFLKKIQYKGITGDIAFDQFGDIKNGALTIYTYKGGKKEVVQVVK